MLYSQLLIVSGHVMLVDDKKNNCHVVLVTENIDESEASVRVRFY